MELAVELFQRLMLTVSVLAVEGCSGHDLTELVVPSSASSCRQASERSGLHTAAAIGRWWLFSEMRRSQCLLQHARDRRHVGGPCPQRRYWIFLLIGCRHGRSFVSSRPSMLKKRLLRKVRVGWEEDVECILKLSTKALFCGG